MSIEEWFVDEPGWVGSFSRGQAAGAIPNGSAIVKVNGEAGDSTPDGTLGEVLGSISHPEIFGGAILYFVQWEYRPRCAVAVMHWKIERAPANA